MFLCLVVKAVKVIKCKCLLFTLCGVKLKWGFQSNFESLLLSSSSSAKGHLKMIERRRRVMIIAILEQHLHTNIDFEEHLVMDNFFKNNFINTLIIKEILT